MMVGLQSLFINAPISTTINLGQTGHNMKNCSVPIWVLCDLETRSMDLGIGPLSIVAKSCHEIFLPIRKVSSAIGVLNEGT